MRLHQEQQQYLYSKSKGICNFIRKVKGDKYGRNDKRNAEMF